MLDVFISWSGTQSKAVAEALKHYLPLMLNAVRPWLSSADIDAGARWAKEIATQLEQSKVGIICLTPTNLDAPWIHFEAGALAKTMANTYVCPYLMDVNPADLKGPLTQFQAKRANDTDTRHLLETLNSALGDDKLKPEQLTETFNTWYPKLKEKLDAIPKEENAAEQRKEREMLEELLELVRGVARAVPKLDPPIVVSSPPRWDPAPRGTFKSEEIRILAESVFGVNFSLEFGPDYRTFFVMQEDRTYGPFDSAFNLKTLLRNFIRAKQLLDATNNS